MAKRSGKNIYLDAPVALRVRVMDIDEGFVTYEDVRLVRIKSKNYTLLVMRNYTPTIGDIEGSVDILLTDNEIHYEKIRAFYDFQDNEFFLLITAKEKENA